MGWFPQASRPKDAIEYSGGKATITNVCRACRRKVPLLDIEDGEHVRGCLWNGCTGFIEGYSKYFTCFCGSPAILWVQGPNGHLNACSDNHALIASRLATQPPPPNTP